MECSEALAKIYARLIYKGFKTIDDVPTAWQDAVISAYYTLFGETLVPSTTDDTTDTSTTEE